MKKLVFLLTLLVLLAAVAPVFAQQNAERDSTFYYVNIPVERVYVTNQGYLIRYWTQDGVATVGIPKAWFTEAAGKADYVVLPKGVSMPTLSVFYNDGEFSHLRLYVHRAKGHISWGHLQHGVDVSEFFPDGDSIELEF